MDIQMGAFVFGCLLLFIAILGGGFEVKELKVPKVGRASRLFSCLFGMLFVVVGIKPFVAGILPGLLAASQPPATAPPAQTKVTEPPPAPPSVQVPPQELRPVTEPPRQPRIGKPVTRKSMTNTPREPGKRPLKQKVRKVWKRLKAAVQ